MNASVAPYPRTGSPGRWFAGRQEKKMKERVIRAVKWILCFGVVTAMPMAYGQTLGDSWIPKNVPEKATKKMPAAPTESASSAQAREPRQSQSGVLRPLSLFRDCPDCPELFVVPAGRYMMGGTDEAAEPVELPRHLVTIRRSFAIGTTEVTQGQWRALMGNNPSRFKTCGDDCPVENVSWYDANDYIKKLNAKTGQQYRLPSEAEWEYVCSEWSIGSERLPYCLYSEPEYSWYVGNSGGKTHRVAQLGKIVYDMNGNVWEWLQDCWSNDYTQGPEDERAMTNGDCGLRVVRGGSWEDPKVVLRPSFRDMASPMKIDSHIGFRIARSIPP